MKEPAAGKYKAYGKYHHIKTKKVYEKEFYILPVGEKLIQYDMIAVNTIVKDKVGEVSSCDIPAADDLNAFNRDYLQYTTQFAASCVNRDLSADSMVIGGSWRDDSLQKQ